VIGFVSWSQDGKYLYFDTLFTDKPLFGRVKIRKSQFEPLVDLKGINRYIGPFSQWNGVAQDASPILVRDISTQGDLCPRRAVSVIHFASWLGSRGRFPLPMEFTGECGI
jgi:hypothetical protein